MRRHLTTPASIAVDSTDSWPSGQRAASWLVGAGGGHGSVRGKRMICEAFLVEPPGGPLVT
jgi:hypothetical protein